MIDTIKKIGNGVIPASGAALAVIEAKIDVIDGYMDVPAVDVATNAVIRDVIGNKNDTVSGTSIVSLVKIGNDEISLVHGQTSAMVTPIATISLNQFVPTVDHAGNSTTNQVIGNKNDTITGTSIVSLVKVGNDLQNVAGVDSVINLTQSDVIGNKNDTISGTSIVSLVKVGNDLQNVAGVDSAINLTQSDVIGNKNDTVSGSSLVSATKRIESEIDEILLPYDYDLFGEADADANTERWDTDYVLGTEGGAGDINTTTANKLHLEIHPDATPTPAIYAALDKNIIKSQIVKIMSDVNLTFGTPAAAIGNIWAEGGIALANGIDFVNNYISISRQQATDMPLNQITAKAMFGGVVQTDVSYITSDAVLSFKIERNFKIYTCWYSLTQPPAENWVKLAQFEDTSNVMTNVQASAFVMTPASIEAQTIDADFSNFYIYTKTDLARIEKVVDSADASGTFSYLDAAGEQTIYEMTNSTRKILYGVWLDFNELTQDATIRVWYKIDGTNYVLIDELAFTVATDSDGIYINRNWGITEDFKITIERGGVEGAAHDIPYSIIYENKE